ncbi:MAG: YMGG-like glycine zipper-containing protein [Gemmatimonadaceae bacterium]
MKNIKMLLLVPAALLAAACGRDNAKTDDALKNDLALASQAQPYGAQQFTSPAEMGYAYNPYTGQFQPVPQPQAQAPVVQRVSARPASTVRRTSTARSSGTQVVYQERREPVRHTKRDAAIGAVAGAVIGATVSRDKVKGGLIGAVAGGVLGGIIGHTIDVERP